MARKGVGQALHERRGKDVGVELAVDKGVTGKPDVVMLPIRQLRTDGGTQNRAALHDDTIKAYKEIMEDAGGWGPFPEVEAYYDGSTYWLVDGFHRVFVALNLFDNLQVPVEVRPGTLKDAILRSLRVNHAHGLPRSNADKRRAVIRMLTDQDYGWHLLSDRQIADYCAVSARMVGMVRSDLTKSGRLRASEMRVGADERTIHTGGIGRLPVPKSAMQPVLLPDPVVSFADVATPEPEPVGRPQPLARPHPLREQEMVDVRLTRATAIKLHDAVIKQTLKMFLTPSETEEVNKALRLVLIDRM